MGQAPRGGLARPATPLTPGQPARPARPAQAADSAQAGRIAHVPQRAVPGPAQAAQRKIAGSPPVARRGAAVVVGYPGDSSAMTSAALLNQFRPGTSDLVTGLSRRLAGHAAVAPLLVVPPQAAAPDAPSDISVFWIQR